MLPARGGDDAGDVLLAAHHDELELAQVVVGGGFERGRQNLFQHLVRHFPVGKVPDGSPFFQYFIEIHNVFCLVGKTCCCLRTQR